MSIHHVSDTQNTDLYHSTMQINDEPWRRWPERLKLHVKEKGLQWSQIAADMNVTEGTVRHWRKGVRDINLKDFFQLCAVAQADAYLVLFGRPFFSPEQTKKLTENLNALFSDPSSHPEYRKFSSDLKRATPTLREARATYKNARAPKTKRGSSSS